MTENLMKKKELAEFLGVSVATISRYEKAGMPVIRPPYGAPKYDKDAVMEWMKSKPKKGGRKR